MKSRIGNEVANAPESLRHAYISPASQIPYRQCHWTRIQAEVVSSKQLARGTVLNNPLTPNDPYRGRTAPLTSKRFILYIYSTNIGTEYFKHDIYSPFFFS